MATPDHPSFSDLVSVAKRLAFHNGTRTRQPPFNPLLFSANVDLPDTIPSSDATIWTARAAFLAYWRFWTENTQLLSKDTALQQQMHAALDAALREANTETTLAAITSGNDLLPKASVLANHLAGPDRNTYCVKLVVGRIVDGCCDSGTRMADSRLVELFFSERDDWRDAEKSLGLWFNVYGDVELSVDKRRGTRWEYCFENPTGRAVEKERHVLDSSVAFKGMCAKLRSLRRNGVETTALVYQTTWREMISGEVLKLEVVPNENDLKDELRIKVKTEEQEVKEMAEFMEWCESDGFACEYVGTASLPPQSVDEWRASSGLAMMP